MFPIVLIVFILTALACLVFRRDGLRMLVPSARSLPVQFAIGFATGVGIPVLCVLSAYLAGEVDLLPGADVIARTGGAVLTVNGLPSLFLKFLEVAFVEETIFRGAMLVVPYLLLSWIVGTAFRLIRRGYDARTGCKSDSTEQGYGIKSSVADGSRALDAIERTLLAIVACLSVVIQAVVFAQRHSDNPHFDTGYGLVNIYLAGIMFGMLTLKPGSIWLAMLIHFLWNTTSAMLGSPVSGYYIDYGAGSALFRFGDTGFVGGGSFGIEGGFACTAFLSATIILWFAFAFRPQYLRSRKNAT